MSFTFDIQKIAAYLSRYKEQLPVLYKWKVNLNQLIDLNILTSGQAVCLDKLTSFEREIQLKHIIGKQLNVWEESNNALFKVLCLWIIKEWGGIKGGKDDETLKCVFDFLNCQSTSFNRISSTSKVGSFLYPAKYVIYDSRVAYSINWIILSQNAGKFFFPIPEGRNSRMAALDLSVLIRLKNISNYQYTVKDHEEKQFIRNRDKSLFIPENTAYSEFCRVINLVNKELWGRDKEKAEKLYYTEMLLFAIADRQIFQEITQTLSLNIANFN